MSEGDATPLTDDPLRRTRALATLVLVILASLGVVVSLVGNWVRTTLFDTETFIEVIDSSLESDEVTAVLADAVSAQVTEALALERRLETQLTTVDEFLRETLVDALDPTPAQRLLLSRVDLPELAGLAPSLAAPIEQRIDTAVQDFVRSDAVQDALPDAVAFAHRGAVAVILGDVEDLENVAIVDGEVRWNALPVVQNAIIHVFDQGILDAVVDTLGLSTATYVGVREDALAALSAALGEVLPDDFGQVTVMREETLEGWQTLARLLNRTAILAIVATLALVAAALAVSGDRRRTVVQLGVGIVAALIVTAIVQRNVIAAVDAAIPGPPGQAAADVIIDAVLGNLRAVAWAFVTIAAAVAVVAHVAGNPRWFTQLRGRPSSEPAEAGTGSSLERWIGGHRDAFTFGGVAIALVGWWIVGLGALSLAIGGVLLGTYLWYVSHVASAAPAPALPTQD